MTIRNGAKAVVLHEGQVLVNRCKNAGIYYDLPGGGQHPYETMEEAVVREVLEETGYQVKVERFLAMTEEIWDDPIAREKSPDYTHRIIHIFLATLTEERAATPTEMDFEQQETLWIPLAEADSLPFLPKALTGKLSQLLADNGQFLGTVRMQ